MPNYVIRKEKLFFPLSNDTSLASLVAGMTDYIAFEDNSVLSHVFQLMVNGWKTALHTFIQDKYDWFDVLEIRGNITFYASFSQRIMGW